MVGQECEFKVGDIVKIRKDSQYYGEDADNNPANILGDDVVKVYDDDDPGALNVLVVWKTGCRNSYAATDLELAEIGEQKDSIREMRDRIYAIDAELKSLQEEREKLVENLREEGLVLVEKHKDHDMSDWRNWQVGDIVYIKEFSEDYDRLVAPGEYPILEVEGSHYCGELPCRIGRNFEDDVWPRVANMKWVRRP